ncbi:MAG: hypothetical protein WDZ80_01890 [Candidatus Paceibacterota bacterium]
MSDKKHFTFEDWKTGRIYRALKDQSLKDFDYSIVEDVGWFPTHLYENGYMEADVLQKISEAQKDCFFKAVANNVAHKVSGVKRQLESAFKPKELLEKHIQSITEGIETFPDKSLTKVYAEDWSRLMIDYTIHMRLNDERLEFGSYEIAFSNQYVVPDRLERDQSRSFKTDVPSNDNHLLNLTTAVKLLDELKDLYKSKFPDKSEKETITRVKILQRAYLLKENGMSVDDMFNDISEWLIDKLGFDHQEIKRNFNFSLNSPDTFNRFVNDNPPHKK